METRICLMCNQEKDIEEFPLRNQFTSRRQSYCKECKAKMDKNWYENNKEHHVQNVEANTKRTRQSAREFVYLYLLAHPCVGPDRKDCPYNETDPAVFEFHHVGEKIGKLGG